MTWHIDSIYNMTAWELVDKAGGLVMEAEAVHQSAILERRRPVDIAKREAKLQSDPEAGTVFARRSTWRHPKRRRR